jgi:hypothetical protein
MHLHLLHPFQELLTLPLLLECIITYAEFCSLSYPAERLSDYTRKRTQKRTLTSDVHMRMRMEQNILYALDVWTYK